ncbi:MAG TPA: alpha-glucan family phosphorylase [Nitrososphaerales archaeon]
MGDKETIASFCMECGLILDEKKGIATPHAGGLGVLEGDNFLTARDLKQPYVAVSLLHHNGYVRQEIDGNSEQVDLDERFDMSLMERRKERVTVNIDRTEREVFCYQYSPFGTDLQTVLYLSVDGMDARLYRGDKIAKSMILGIGGVRLLREMGYDLYTMHFKINESNAALTLIELLRTFESEEIVKTHSSFVTHTTLPHGHDVYDLGYARQRLQDDPMGRLLSSAEFQRFVSDGVLNLSNLASNIAGKTFAVSKQHGEIARHNFPNISIDYLTNGVHWSHISERKQKVFDKYLGSWRIKPELLRQSEKIPAEEIQDAHDLDKADLINYVKEETGVELSIDRPISGFLRRQTAYKRPLYLFSDIERLKSLVAKFGLQHIQGGKTHPDDTEGKNAIREYHRIMRDLDGAMRLTFIKNYGLTNHKILLNGIDFLIYSPVEDQEACGTSYMKAMSSGVPVLGSLSGGFLEVCQDNVNSFAFRTQEEFYDKLEHILNEYRKNRLAETRRNAIASGAFASSVRAFQEFRAKIE